MEDNSKKTESISIGRVVTESHPHFAYWCENKHGFSKDDIITTAYISNLTEKDIPIPDREIYVVRDIIDDHTFCTNRAIVPLPAGKIVCKLTTVADITSKLPGASQEAIHEQEVRLKMQNLFLNEEFTGTIEERLMSGYLYTLSQEDLTLPAGHPEREAMKTVFNRPVTAQTGKAGVLAYVQAGKRGGETEAMIARNIWIEMVIEGVKLYVNIKNLKITKKDELDKPE